MRSFRFGPDPGDRSGAVFIQGIMMAGIVVGLVHLIWGETPTFRRLLEMLGLS